MTIPERKELAFFFGEDSLSFALELAHGGTKIVLVDSYLAPHTVDMLSYHRRPIRNSEEAREVLAERKIPFSSMEDYRASALTRGLIDGSYGYGLKKECVEVVDKLLSTIPSASLFVQSDVSLLQVCRLALFTLVSDFFSFMKLADVILDDERPDILRLGCLENPLALATKRLAEERQIEVISRQSEVSEPISKSSKSRELWKRYKILRATGWARGEILREVVGQARKRIPLGKQQARSTDFRHGGDSGPRVLLTSGIRSVITELSRLEGLFDVAYLGFNTGLPEIYDSGTDGRETGLNRERTMERLARGWEAIEGSRECHEALTLQGVRLLNAFKEFWEFFFCEFLLEYAEFVSRMAGKIDRMNPQVAIVETDVTPGPRTLVELCNARRIPTVVFQHGVMAAEFGFVPVVASRIAVWGEIPRQWLAERGTDESKVAVIGWPRYDVIKNRGRRIDGQGVRNRLRIGAGAPIILLAIQPTTGAEKALLIEACIMCLKSVPDAVLVIRGHPSEGIAEILRLSTDLARKHAMDNRVRVNAETRQKYPGTIFELIAASALVITTSSGTGLDAILMGKPLIAANLTRSPDDLDYAKYGAALGTSTMRELSDAIRRILADRAAREVLLKKQDEFLSRYCLADGNAIERFVDLISSLAENSRRTGSTAIESEHKA